MFRVKYQTRELCDKYRPVGPLWSHIRQFETIIKVNEPMKDFGPRINEHSAPEVLRDYIFCNPEKFKYIQDKKHCVRHEVRLVGYQFINPDPRMAEIGKKLLKNAFNKNLV